MYFTVLAAATFGVFLATVLSLLPFAHGLVRLFDFPRLQIAILSTALLVITLASFPWRGVTWIPVGLLVTVIAVQAAHIAKFSPIWQRSVKRFEGDLSATTAVRILVSNVKQSNRDYDKLCLLVRQLDPDIAIFMETDRQWVSALDSVVSAYPARMECALDNSYGMFMVSRFRLVDDHVRFHLNDEVPSFDAMVEPNDDCRFRLFVVHPEPPVPTRDTVGRDAEIILVGRMARDETAPTIVTGDLNDVAWSRTTRRFQRISRLLDPRQGRGQYNSFDARYFFLRWPLDHIFHSAHFQVIAIRRLPFVGSDHFPMYYELALTRQEDAVEKPDPATAQDEKAANELVATEKSRNRHPPGTDWEEES